MLAVAVTASGDLVAEPTEEEAGKSCVGTLPPEACAHRLAGRWRHFKGGEYDFLAVVHGTADGPLVLYIDASGGVWLRPASMVDEIVDHSGERVRRFERIAG